jgi:phosphoribosylformylglycinamidine cyclo-ligase
VKKEGAMSQYKRSGVDIDAQEEAIGRIKAIVADTKTPGVLSDIGLFGGLYDAAFAEESHPVLVASADGVGTKLKIAFLAERHDTVGQCLVNHCVNDILVQGARPLFFLDYIATGKLAPSVVEGLVRGMGIACKENQMAILGGEMAEMPGFYQAGEYDVAGFIVGVVDGAKRLPREPLGPGLTLIGLPSNGLHTNGYSLARSILLDQLGLDVHQNFPGLDRSVGEVLLQTHRSYYPLLWPLLQENLLEGMAHITGGGLMDNLPRVLAEDCDALVNPANIPVQRVFQVLCEQGEVHPQEAYRVFNMGVGMVLLVQPDRLDKVLATLQSQGEAPFLLGQTVQGTRQVQMVFS